MKKYVLIFLAAAFLFVAPVIAERYCETAEKFTVTANAEKYSSDCGDHMKWELDTETGVLNITGRGEMRFTDVLSRSDDDEDESDEDELYIRYRAPWYNYSSYIKTVNIQEGVKSIYEFAFEKCSNLKNINIPDSVKSVGMEAFNDTAYYKKSANWENGVLYIGKVLVKVKSSVEGLLAVKEGTVCIADDACSYRRKITEVTLPDSVVRIGRGAFRSCSGLKNISLNRNLLYVEAMAFSGCSKLESVVIPKKVKYVLEDAFWKSGVKDLCFMGPSTRIGYAYESPYIEEYTVLHGYKDSQIEEYADTFGLKFDELKDGHIWKATSAISKATLTKAGKGTFTCTDCGKTKNDILPAIGTVELKYTYYRYDGRSKKPPVIAADTQGKKLVEGKDYTVSYTNNKAIGNASVKVTFKGLYSGTKTLSFKIRPENVTGLSFTSTTTSVTLSWDPVMGAATYRIYKYSPTKNRFTQIDSTSNTSITFKKLSPDTNYVYYVRASKNVGRSTYACASYERIKTTTKAAAPKAPVLTAGENKFTAKWDKVQGVNGYNIAYSTSKNGSYKVICSTTPSVTVKGLNKGTTYYVKLRTYKTDGQVCVHSLYSEPKAIKVK